MSNGEYPIRTGLDGRRVYHRVRCDLCSGTRVKCTGSHVLSGDMKVRYYECKECQEFGPCHAPRPHTFKVTVI